MNGLDLWDEAIFETKKGKGVVGKLFLVNAAQLRPW